MATTLHYHKKVYKKMNLQEKALSPYVVTERYEYVLSQHYFDSLLIRIKPESFCRFVIEDSPMPQLFYNPTTGAIYAANQAFSKLLEYELCELSCKKVVDLLHPDDRRFEQEFLGDDLKNKTTATNSVKRFWSKDGNTVWVNFSCKCAINERKEIIFALATLFDISEYKLQNAENIKMICTLEDQLAQQLQKSKNTLCQIEQIKQYKKRFIDIMSHEFRTPLTIIQTSCEILQRYRDKIDNDQLEKRYQNIYDAIARLTVMLDEVLDIEPIVELNQMSSHELATSVRNNVKQQFFASAPISTQERFTETAAENKSWNGFDIANNTNTSLQTIEENIKILIHDLQNPLASIMLTASSIERNWNKMVFSDIMGSLHLIERYGLRMKEMMSRFLEASAVESVQSSIKFDSVELIDLLKALIDEYRERAKTKRISIRLLNSMDSLYLYTDKNLMIQILDNVLSNAVKYSHGGSFITLSLNAIAQGNQHYVAIKVEDTGQGIKQDDMKRMFTKFGRLSARPTGEEASTGLGLWIVKRLVEAINGKVECTSIWGKGTVFTLTFPL